MSARSIRRASERRERSASRRRAVRAGAATAGATLLFAGSAEAATFTVNSTADPGDGTCEVTPTGDCTLREAVDAANAVDDPDEIVFDLGTGPDTIGLNADDLELTQSVTITGPGAGLLTLNAGSAAPPAGFNGESRVFDITASITTDTSISGMTVTGGLAGTYDPAGPTYTAGNGGAISASNTNLTLDDVVATGNVASGNGGGVYLSGGRLTVTDSAFNANTAYGYGGGAAAVGALELTMTDPTITDNVAVSPNFGFPLPVPRGGGLYASVGDVSIEGATITDNLASDGVLGQGGGALIDGNGTISESFISGNDARRYGGIALGYEMVGESLTVTDNYASSVGGGVHLDSGAELRSSTVSLNGADGRGGGISFEDEGNRVVNSTVSGNMAGTGGGIASYLPNAGLALRNSTVTDNSADVGGALAAAPNDPPDVIIRSSILANSTEIGPETPLPDLSSSEPEATFDVGFSLVEDPGTDLVVEQPPGSNIFGVDPALGPLADNGGPTETHLPANSSAVVDAAVAGGLSTDQRGLARPVDAAAPTEPLSDGTDMGAVEIQDASATGGDDVQAPDTAITGGPSGAGNPAAVSFSFSSPDGTANFECSLDGAPFAACTSPATFSGLAVGPHSFEVRARDAAGNVDPTPATRLFNVGFPLGPDRIAPQTLITSAPPKKLKAKGKKGARAKFAFEGLDDRGGVLTFECKLDARAYEPCTSPTSLKLKRGKHTFSVRARDAAGNVDGSPDSATVKVKVKKKKKK